MTQTKRLVTVIHTENAVKEMWSMLSFFQSECNVETYLTSRFNEFENLAELKIALAYTVKTAEEYYVAAESVTDLTRPLLLFYGMSTLSKALFMAKHGKLSPSRSHGLTAEDESLEFQEQVIRVSNDGTFPQFHGCFSSLKLEGYTFSLKELLSLIPELKVNFETVYNQKSNTIRIERSRHGISLVDPEFQEYGNLEVLSKVTTFKKQYEHFQFFKDHAFLFTNPDEQEFIIKALSGEEFWVLPLIKKQGIILLPEMSIHYLIMYLLGILSRYTSKKWLELLSGSKTGEIYIIQKFLEVSRRKFPNLVLNELHNKQFVFAGPKFEDNNHFSNDQLDEIYDNISRRNMDALMGY
jgi:hypothetical protein